MSIISLKPCQERPMSPLKQKKNMRTDYIFKHQETRKCKCSRVTWKIEKLYIKIRVIKEPLTLTNFSSK